MTYACDPRLDHSALWPCLTPFLTDRQTDRKGVGGNQLYFRCASLAMKRKQLSLLLESRMHEGRESRR